MIKKSYIDFSFLYDGTEYGQRLALSKEINAETIDSVNDLLGQAIKSIVLRLEKNRGKVS